MNRITESYLYKILYLLLSSCLAAGIAVANEPVSIESETTTIDTDTTIGINQNPIDKISSKFRPFLGDNTESVVTGLRTGNEITLTTTGAEGTTTSFTPPTGKMGYGNVSHALNLAKEQLAQYGITEPTATELQAALVGGDITAQSGGMANIDGVLTLRSEGMGWGEIAHEYGVKLGHVISSSKTGREAPLMNNTSTQTRITDKNDRKQAAAVGKSDKAPGKGIVTGAGGTSASAKNIKVAAKQGKSRGYGGRIITAGGAPVTESKPFSGNIKALSGGSGHGHGHGVITAGGASASSSGITNGKGGGRRLAKGLSK